MKPTFANLFSCFLLSLNVSFVTADDAVKKSDSPAIILFDGSDLSNWKGLEGLWTLEDGQIVGRTSAETPIKTNTFLIYQGDLPSDFEMVAWYKIESGNSGIQYRSKVVDQEKYVVGGYQADIDFGNRFAGILYEERGRGILAVRGEKVTIGQDGKKQKETFADAQELGAAIHPGQWNEFRVVAKGHHLQHFINGTMTMELFDHETEKSSSNGVIALQLHQGPPMVVRFKNITVKPLN